MSFMFSDIDDFEEQLSPDQKQLLECMKKRGDLDLEKHNLETKIYELEQIVDYCRQRRYPPRFSTFCFLHTSIWVADLKSVETDEKCNPNYWIEYIRQKIDRFEDVDTLVELFERFDFKEEANALKKARNILQPDNGQVSTSNQISSRAFNLVEFPYENSHLEPGLRECENVLNILEKEIETLKIKENELKKAVKASQPNVVRNVPEISDVPWKWKAFLLKFNPDIRIKQDFWLYVIHVLFKGIFQKKWIHRYRNSSIVIIQTPKGLKIGNIWDLEKIEEARENYKKDGESLINELVQNLKNVKLDKEANVLETVGKMFSLEFFKSHST